MLKGSYDGLAVLGVVVALFAMNAAVAQSRSVGGREAFYRCKDATGQTHYGDSMPQSCMGFDTEVLNERGMQIRMIEGDRTKAARLQREAADVKVRTEREARAQRDRMLIDTYTNVADIERLRDQRLELLVSQYRVTEQNIKNLRERQTRLDQQISRFKPYNDKSNAPPLPDHLAEEMVNLVNGSRVYAESLTKNKQEQARVKSTFEADIRRFKELRGIK
jgi:Domain of unknown function (DUF4124)